MIFLPDGPRMALRCVSPRGRAVPTSQSSPRAGQRPLLRRLPTFLLFRTERAAHPEAPGSVSAALTGHYLALVQIPIRLWRARGQGTQDASQPRLSQRGAALAGLTIDVCLPGLPWRLLPGTATGSVPSWGTESSLPRGPARTPRPLFSRRSEARRLRPAGGRPGAGRGRPSWLAAAAFCCVPRAGERREALSV